MYGRYCDMAISSKLYKFLRRIHASWRTWSSIPYTRFITTKLHIFSPYEKLHDILIVGFADRTAEPKVSKSTHFRFLFQRRATGKLAVHHRYIRKMVSQHEIWKIMHSVYIQSTYCMYKLRYIYWYRYTFKKNDR